MRRNIVVVDKEAKELNKYKRLMMYRAQREKDIIKDRVGNDTPNKRVLVWKSTNTQYHFEKIELKVCLSEKSARKYFKKHEAQEYWDLALA